MGQNNSAKSMPLGFHLNVSDTIEDSFGTMHTFTGNAIESVGDGSKEGVYNALELVQSVPQGLTDSEKDSVYRRFCEKSLQDDTKVDISRKSKYDPFLILDRLKIYSAYTVMGLGYVTGGISALARFFGDGANFPKELLTVGVLGFVIGSTALGYISKFGPKIKSHMVNKVRFLDSFCEEIDKPTRTFQTSAHRFGVN
jgi:hypothetical protein